MDKIFSIDVFGKQMFESCAKQWLKLCKEQKREWILKNTSQTDESLITEFINNPKISKDCKCLDCGKNKKDDKRIGISKEVTAITEPVQIRTDGKRNSTKRQPKTKRVKG